MKTKKQKSKFLILTLSASILLVLSVVAVTVPLSELLPGLPEIEQRKQPPKWKHTADVYQTTWEYTSGGGRQDKIGFTLTVEDDVIKDVAVEVFTASKDSRVYQTNFGKELPKVVIGKKLSEIAGIDTVSGASGTTKNFKAAVAELEKQLKG